MRSEGCNPRTVSSTRSKRCSLLAIEHAGELAGGNLARPEVPAALSQRVAKSFFGQRTALDQQALDRVDESRILRREGAWHRPDATGPGADSAARPAQAGREGEALLVVGQEPGPLRICQRRSLDVPVGHGRLGDLPVDPDGRVEGVDGVFS